MRFLIHEQPYEKPLAAGAYRYEQDGQPTGGVELWRLTRATADFVVLRVDVDERAVNGRSTLFHLLRQENGRPERLTYRLWDGQTRIEGKLVFNETSVIGTRTVNGKVFEEDVELVADYSFWFPSAMGMGTAVLTQTSLHNHAVTLNPALDGPANALAVQPVAELSVMPLPGSEQTMLLGGQEIVFWSTNLMWEKQIVGLGQVQTGFPIRVAWMDGKTAVASRQIHYT